MTLLKKHETVKSTTENTKIWRCWHGISYFIGGFGFLIGSIVLFPIFYEICDAGSISAWLYTVGSLCFVLADLTEWNHYQNVMKWRANGCCIHPIESINFLLSACGGSLLYLIGSIFFIPSLNMESAGLFCFDVGSFFVCISQSWKIYRSLKAKEKSLQENLFADVSGFFVDLLAGVGGLFYLIGSIYLQLSDANEQIVLTWVAILYTVGGIAFFCSAIFMQKRYFCESTKLINESELPSLSQ